MITLLFDMEIDGALRQFSVSKVNGIFEVIHDGKLMVALRPPGEDWEIMDIAEVMGELPLFEQDLRDQPVKIHTYDINQIIGLIENHWGLIK